MKYFLACVLFLAGCFAQRNEVVQKDSLSYLLFSGSYQGASFSAYKENAPVYDSVKIQANQKYSIAPGTYRIEVRHKGEIITNRLLFFSDGQTQEIRLP
ncbi:MAG: hypothetical protein HUU50_18830 [Candidatus Brocadiae bacterium]|nr:hypothetical protein [Candidatus Brocadiia bacterium]